MASDQMASSHLIRIYTVIMKGSIWDQQDKGLLMLVQSFNIRLLVCLLGTAYHFEHC